MKKLIISPRVDISMASLDPEGAKRLLGWFDDLRRWDEDEAVRKNSVLLDSIPGVFVMRTSTDIRIFFRIDGDTVTVLNAATTAAIFASAGISAPASAGAVINPDPQVK
jgi:hypothetical protein